MTSISLYGAYPDADEEYPAPRWGHPKDSRPDLKQIQAGLAVAADGGIPVFHHAYDGGAGEVAQVTGAMTALKKIAGPRTFLLVGDSKLISWANATAMAAGQVAFIAPLAASRVPAGLFAARPAGAGTEVDHVAARDAGKPAAARGTYRVAEDDGGMDIRGPRKTPQGFDLSNRVHPGLFAMKSCQGTLTLPAGHVPDGPAVCGRGSLSSGHAALSASGVSARWDHAVASSYSRPVFRHPCRMPTRRLATRRIASSWPVSRARRSS